MTNQKHVPDENTLFVFMNELTIANNRILNLTQSLQEAVDIAKKRKITRDYTPEDDHLNWLLTHIKAEPKRTHNLGRFVTFEMYKDACEKADKDQHRIGFCESFFERVVRHLGLKND